MFMRWLFDASEVQGQENPVPSAWRASVAWVSMVQDHQGMHIYGFVWTWGMSLKCPDSFRQIHRLEKVVAGFKATSHTLKQTERRQRLCFNHLSTGRIAKLTMTYQTQQKKCEIFPQFPSSLSLFYWFLLLLGLLGSTKHFYVYIPPPSDEVYCTLGFAHWWCWSCKKIHHCCDYSPREPAHLHRKSVSLGSMLTGFYNTCPTKPGHNRWSPTSRRGSRWDGLRNLGNSMPFHGEMRAATGLQEWAIFGHPKLQSQVRLVWFHQAVNYKRSLMQVPIKTWAEKKHHQMFSCRARNWLSFDCFKK